MNRLLKSPKLRLVITLVLTIVIGVLSSILATQLMPNGVFDIRLLFSTSGFWILLVVGIIWIWVQVQFMNYDVSILAFADDEHCLAYIRKAKLEGLAQKIKNDPNSAEMVDAKGFLENLGVDLK